MQWISCKDRIPTFNEPIIVFLKKGIINNLFSEEEEIKICYLVEKSETKEGVIFFLKGYKNYKTYKTAFFENDFKKIYWMYLPNKPK